MSIHRVEAQLSLLPLPPKMPEYRRCHCRCGCGRWWYQARTTGRATLYATPECYAKVRRARRAAKPKVVRFRSEPCACGCGEIITQRVQRGRPKRFVNVKHWRNARPEDS